MIPPPEPHAPPPRRSFLKWAIHGMGALFAAALGIPAVAYLIDPRNRKTTDGGLRTVARLSELKPNEPKQVVITETRQDAWTLRPDDPIGRVWLVKRDGDKVEAFTSVCPHLGCSINFEERKGIFLCPCHGAAFNLEGKKLEEAGKTNPSPRGMDALKVEVVPDPNNKRDSLVQVQYEKFAPG